jgi:dephospho-CoA kinase
MILVGLTGVIGSGKSTVAALLRKQGIPVIDLDALAKESLRRTDVQAEIKAAFGDECVGPDGVDIAGLRAMAFARGTDLKRLEEVVHPRVREEAARLIDRLGAEGATAVVVDHPLLFETEFYRRVDKTVVVSTRLDTIQVRLVKRGMEPDDIERRIAFQIPLSEKEARADYVVRNDGTEQELAAEVDLLVARIAEWATKEV